MIEQLANQIFNDIKSTFAAAEEFKDTSSSKLRAVIETKLRSLNLVTREEFDAQTEVLQRTRAKVEELERVLAELEQSLKKGVSDDNGK